MNRRIHEPSEPLLRATTRVVLWIAAFGYATGIFVSEVRRLGFLPETAPIAVGRVTIDHVSKIQEYVAAGIFLLVVPVIAIALERLWEWTLARMLAAWPADRERRDTVTVVSAILFSWPLALSPVIWVYTKKELWSLLTPLVIAGGSVAAFLAAETRSWIRDLTRSVPPVHALLLTEATAWLVYRYLATSRMIAHIPTLVLEVPFFLLFVSFFWLIAVAIARGIAFVRAESLERSLQSVSLALSPLLLLPVAGLFRLDVAPVVASVVVLIAVASIGVGVTRPELHETALRRSLVYLVIPVLLFCVDYASSASPSGWIDLFHRGESLGPASDYLRGKTPYLDVFPLHGLLDDGLLDSWLASAFGRESWIVLARPLVLSSLMIPALWYLGWTLFHSMGPAFAVAILGFFMAGDNQRAVLEIAAASMVIQAVRRRRPSFLLPAGILSSLALFFSLEIGLYCLAATVIAIPVLRLISRSPDVHVGRLLGAYLAGVILGALPFVLWLASRGALLEFFRISFVTIPSTIDAIWSIPFPDLVSQFRGEIGRMSLFDWAVRLRFILNPVAIALIVLVLARKALSGNITRFDESLAVVTLFAIMTQRSALGRADAPHQWFAAFLIPPIVVALAFFVGRRIAALWTAGDRGTRGFLVAAVAVVLPVVVTLLFVPTLVNETISGLVRYRSRTGSRVTDPKGIESQRRIREITHFIDQRVSRDRPIFDFSNQPALYYFADRPNPTRFYQVPMMSPDAHQAEVIQDLRANPPVLVVMTSPEGFDAFDGIANRDRAPRIASWIRRHYSPSHRVAGVELWTRRRSDDIVENEPVPRSFDTIIKRGPLRDRAVFPVAGSTPGANESWWRSDLTLHNPHSEPIDVRLLYVSDDLVRERMRRIEARGTIAIPDVIGWMNARRTRGALWLGFAEGSAPIARLATRDVQGHGKPSTEEPLSMRDAAVADSRRSDLVVFGFDANEELRLNLDAVNVGNGEASIRIDILDRDGAGMARPVDVNLPEMGRHAVVDLERLIGRRFALGMSIRVHVSKGSVVASLSVIDERDHDLFVVHAVPLSER